MQISQIPTKWQIAFATNGARNVLPVAPYPTGSNLASQSGGFAPITMTPIASGGVPPQGQDVNAMGFMCSSWNIWQEAGAPIGYDATFSGNIGGYPLGSQVETAAVVGAYWLNLIDQNTTNPDSSGTNWALIKPPTWGGTVWAPGGTVNAITITLKPAPTLTAQLAGTTFTVQTAGANTATGVTINFNGTGALPVLRSDGVAISVGDLTGQPVQGYVVGSNFQLVTPVTSQVTVSAALNYAVDTSGTANLITAAPSPTVPYTSGVTARVLPANNNTGATTVNFNAQGSMAVVRPDGSALLPNDIVANQAFQVVVRAGAFQMTSWPQNPTPASNSVTGGAHTYVVGDAAKTTQRSNSGVAMVDLLPGATAGALPAGWRGTIVNADATGLYALQVGAGSTLTGPGVSNGTVVLGPGQQLSVSCNGTNYTCYGSPGRAKLVANASLFVAPAGSGGSDTANAGVTSGSPFLTGSHAYAWAQQFLDLAGFTLTISLAAGAYAAGVTCSGLVPGQVGIVIFNGAGSGSTSVTAGNPVSVINGAVVTFQNVALVATATAGSACVGVSTSGSGGLSTFFVGTGLTVTGGLVGTFVVERGGQVVLLNSYTIAGGAAANHWLVNSGGVIDNGNSAITVTLTGTPSFSSAFATALATGLMNPGGSGLVTFSGAAIGTRYNIASNGTINTNGAGATYLPGNSAGTGQTANYF